MTSLFTTNSTTIEPDHLTLLKLVFEEHCSENGIDTQSRDASEVAKWLVRSYRRGECKEPALRRAIDARYGARLR